MKDSKKYFHPETIRKISRLELRSRYLVEGLLSGMHRSPFFGQSIEFRQHRDYVQGDDLRHVDWKVWARQDRFYVKQFEADTNLNCHLLVDCSSSMAYGVGTFDKFEYAATLACCLAYLVNRQKDNVGCTLFDSTLGTGVECKNRSSQLEAIAALFDRPSPDSKTSLSSVLNVFSNRSLQRGLVVLISDFFDQVDEVQKGLQLLRQQGHDVLLIHLLDRDEIDFPFDRPTHFEGMETSDQLRCHPQAYRDSYLEAMNDFRQDLSRASSATACDYELCTTDMAFNTVLSRLIHRRKGQAGR